MNINEYQIWTRTTAIYPGALEGGPEERQYLTLGLCSEAGELASLAKKEMRDGISDNEEFIWKMKKEISDNLWYIAREADSVGITLEELAQINYDKLEDRKCRNKIGGSGDDR